MTTPTYTDDDIDAVESPEPLVGRIRAVRFEVDPGQWDPDEAGRRMLAIAGRVWQWYIYDEMQGTHLCELPLSRELWGIGYETEHDPDPDDPDYEDAVEAFDQWFMEAFADEPQSMYQHCRFVDCEPCIRYDEERIELVHFDDDLADEQDRRRAQDQWMEDQVESFMGNMPAATQLKVVTDVDQ